MTLPDNITKEHIIEALKSIDKQGVRSGRQSSTYDLVFEGKRYPPKLVITIANKYANGTELSHKEFQGGEGKWAFNTLKRAGFKIEKKNDPFSKIDTKWIQLAQVVKKINNESAVRKFFNTCKYVLTSLNQNDDHPNFYCSAIDNQIQFTIGSRYIANVKGASDRTRLGFYISKQAFDKISKVYSEIKTSPGPNGIFWVKVNSENLNEEDFFNGVLDVSKNSMEDQSKSQFRSQYSNLHNGWILRSVLDETILQSIIEFTEDGFRPYYEEWLKGNVKSGKPSSYVRSIDILSEKLNKEIFQVMNINYLNKLYGDLVEHQYDQSEKGKYYNEATSYGTNGFYSASIKEYIAFLSEFELQKIKPITMKYPLNTIFYGPPGTGKTYNTIMRAAEIVNNTDQPISSYQEALEIYRDKLHDQIEFITFHQNYSYEDFIEGLRPDTEDNDQLTFQKKEGIFKRIAEKAKKNYEESQTPTSKKKRFEEVFNEYVQPLTEGEVEEIEVPMKKVSYFITSITNKSIDFRKASGGTAHSLSIATLRKMYEAESVLEIQGLASYYQPLLDQLLQIGKDPTEKVEVPLKNYVLIIDEINRANISRVFGELITLIEENKRFGNEAQMEVVLPSEDKFSVPKNLYLIGTMNTADKSIALLDIALRRRFIFESMYPKYDLDGLQDIDIFKKINDYIIRNKGHDFQIGHAYFMEDNDLKTRMDNKVIPLLMEYFMNDEKEVKKIIAEAGLEVEENTWPLKIKG